MLEAELELAVPVLDGEEPDSVWVAVGATDSDEEAATGSTTASEASTIADFGLPLRLGTVSTGSLATGALLGLPRRLSGAASASTWISDSTCGSALDLPRLLGGLT